jgi:hypothetical protein
VNSAKRAGADMGGGGSIVDWAKSRGGIAAIPPAERLEVVAKIASVLTALHSLVWRTL